jgi:hypothetical protein
VFRKCRLSCLFTGHVGYGVYFCFPALGGPYGLMPKRHPFWFGM